MLPPLLKALLPFIRESLFGKEDPLEVLNRNKTSSVLVLTVMLLAVMVCALIYSYVKLYDENLKFKKGIIQEVVENKPLLTPTVSETLILERLQAIELRLVDIRTSCPSRQTQQADSTIPQCP